MHPNFSFGKLFVREDEGYGCDLSWYRSENHRGSLGIECDTITQLLLSRFLSSFHHRNVGYTYRYWAALSRLLRLLL